MLIPLEVPRTNKDSLVRSFGGLSCRFMQLGWRQRSHYLIGVPSFPVPHAAHLLLVSGKIPVLFYDKPWGEPLRWRTTRFLHGLLSNKTGILPEMSSIWGSAELATKQLRLTNWRLPNQDRVPSVHKTARDGVMPWRKRSFSGLSNHSTPAAAAISEKNRLH